MNALLRYPGAKWSTADKIIKFFPEHKGYLEPFFGSGGILFNKNKCGLETINDLNGEVINFFNVLKDINKFDQLQQDLKLTPYSRDVYLSIQSWMPKTDIEKAYKFFLKSWMSHGGYQPHNTGWSHSKNNKGPNKAKVFKSVIDDLYNYAERLREVQIENSDALKLIKQHDFKDTLIYLDPPYVLETRKQYLYNHEMNDNEHIELLNTAVNLQNAYVLISGYDCELYNDILKDWNKKVFNALDGKGNIKREVVWFNYNLEIQESLF